MPGDYAAVYAVEDIRSCAPLSNEKFIELVRNFPGFSLPDNDWAIRLGNPAAARPLLNLLNVKYLLANPRTLPWGHDPYIIRNFSDFTVLENDQAWPRAFFAGEIVPESSNGEFTRYLVQHGDQPFAAVGREQAEHDPNLQSLEHAANTTIVAAEHYQLLPNSTAFDIKTPAPGVVCLTEGQARDFLATANGQPVAVFTVNRAFKGIYLAKPGNYHVKFRYRPHFWRVALTLFCVSAGIVVILGATECARIRRRPHSATA